MEISAHQQPPALRGVYRGLLSPQPCLHALVRSAALRCSWVSSCTCGPSITKRPAMGGSSGIPLESWAVGYHWSLWLLATLRWPIIITYANPSQIIWCYQYLCTLRPPWPSEIMWDRLHCLMSIPSTIWPFLFFLSNWITMMVVSHLPVVDCQQRWFNQGTWDS